MKTLKVKLRSQLNMKSKSKRKINKKIFTESKSQIKSNKNLNREKFVLSERYLISLQKNTGVSFCFWPLLKAYTTKNLVFNLIFFQSCDTITSHIFHYEN
jgi:hypothetical protein